MKETVITRKIKVTQVETMTLDTETAEVTIQVYTLTGKIETNEEKLLKRIQKNFDTDTMKNVVITSVTVRTHTYSMTEKQFALHGELLSVGEGS